MAGRYNRKRNYGRKRNYNRKRRQYNKNSKPTTNFSKRVISVVHKLAETKCANPAIYRGNPILSQLTDNATQCIPLMPIIAQGAGQGDRVGNNVTTRKAYLLLNFWLYQISTSTNVDPPKFVDIYIYKYKPSNTQTSINLREFLQYGNISVEYDQNALPECGLLNVNQDVFTIKKHIRRQLWNPRADNTYAQANRNVQNGMSMKLDITKYYKHNIEFNDATANVVTNDNLFMSMVFTNNDTSTASATIPYGEFSATALFKYDDI